MNGMKKYRVLLADDHALVRAGIHNAVDKIESMEIVGEAKDGPTLMAALNSLKPDILLIDVTMPNFEPISAIDSIRIMYPQMKILVISAYDDDVYVQGLLGLGVNGYHLKDQPLQDLSLAIERIIAGERWISSPLIEKLLKSQPSQDAIPSLTSRQRDILKLLCKGWHNQKIAFELNLSTKTIENHLTRIYRTLNVQSRVEAVNYLNQNPQILNEDRSLDAIHILESVSHDNCGDILLVDDNPRFRYQLHQMINNLFPNLIVHEAGSGDDAIFAAKSTSFKLFFIDVILGEKNGIVYIDQIKRLTPQGRIILISAYPDMEFRRKGLAAGAVALIDKKMLDKDTIKQIIEDCIHCEQNEQRDTCPIIKG